MRLVARLSCRGQNRPAETAPESHRIRPLKGVHRSAPKYTGQWGSQTPLPPMIVSMNLIERERARVTTSRQGAELIHSWAVRNNGRIASAYVYEAMATHTGLSKRQTARALQMSGLYPVRLSHNRVVWLTEPPTPWTPLREVGRAPTVRTVRCVSCGSRYMPTSNAPPVAEWP